MRRPAVAAATSRCCKPCMCAWRRLISHPYVIGLLWYRRRTCLPQGRCAGVAAARSYKRRAPRSKQGITGASMPEI